MYCERADLTVYLLEAYLTVAEEQTPGIVDTTLANVSGEIEEALKSRYALPLPQVPDTLRRIAAVITAYRVVGAITSIMREAGLSDNDWIPLQTQYRQALKDLEAIREGKMDLGLPGVDQETAASNNMIVRTRKPTINMGGW